MVQDMNKRNLSISNFKKNSIFVFKLIIMFLIFLLYINHILPQYAQGYCASLVDKVNRLESINEPKIVLIGHSNLSFGIDSQLIEKELDMPVVNMGLHGGIGNAFHEEMAKLNVNPGDIYIICHGDYDDDDRIGDIMTTWSSIENHYNLWKLLRVKDIETMMRGFPIYLKKCLALYSSGAGNRSPEGIYSRNAFNEYGDIDVLRESSIYTKEEEVSVPGVGDITVNRINKLNKYLIEHKATLLVAGYPIGNGNLTANIDEFLDFQQNLSEKLDCPVISNYIDYMYDYRYFYDYNYLHLNSEGAKMRTEQLISDIKRWKQTGKNADMNSDKYIDIIADVNLSHITNVYEYLNALAMAKNRYTIFISAKNSMLSLIDSEILNHLSDLGLSSNCSKGYSYLAVLEKGLVLYEKSKSGKIEVSGKFDDEKMIYTITSGGLVENYDSSILINGQEYSKNICGLNIVVYSNKTHRILDEAVIDASSSELIVKR